MSLFIDTSISNPNNTEAYSISLLALKKQWMSKYGDVWVSTSKIETGYWQKAFLRLEGNDLFEKARVGYTKDLWVRLSSDLGHHT